MPSALSPHKCDRALHPASNSHCFPCTQIKLASGRLTDTRGHGDLTESTEPRLCGPKEHRSMSPSVLQKPVIGGVCSNRGQGEKGECVKALIALLGGMLETEQCESDKEKPWAKHVMGS